MQHPLRLSKNRFRYELCRGEHCSSGSEMYVFSHFSGESETYTLRTTNGRPYTVVTPKALFHLRQRTN